SLPILPFHRTPVGAETPALTPWESGHYGVDYANARCRPLRQPAMPQIRPPTTRCGFRSIGRACCRLRWPTAGAVRLSDVAQANGVEVLALEIQADHVHLVFSAPPAIAPSLAIQWFKGSTAR